MLMNDILTSQYPNIVYFSNNNNNNNNHLTALFQDNLGKPVPER